MLNNGRSKFSFICPCGLRYFFTLVTHGQLKDNLYLYMLFFNCSERMAYFVVSFYYSFFATFIFQKCCHVFAYQGIATGRCMLINVRCSLFSITLCGPSWSYGRWIHNYLCNQCISPLTLWVRTLLSDLRQVGDFLQVLRFPPSIKLTASIEFTYCWKRR